MGIKIIAEEIKAAPTAAMSSGIFLVCKRSDKYPVTKLEIIHPANVTEAPTAASADVKCLAVFKNGIAHASTKTDDGKYSNAPTIPINHICGIFAMPHNCKSN